MPLGRVGNYKMWSVCAPGVKNGGSVGPSLADDPERQLTRRQADQARDDFATILDDLDFVKVQLARVPGHAWVSRMLLSGFGSGWAMFGALVLWLGE